MTARIPRVSVERQQSGEPLEGTAIVSWYPLHPSVKPPQTPDPKPRTPAASREPRVTRATPEVRWCRVLRNKTERETRFV